MKEQDSHQASMLGEYRRALVFVLPYWRRLVLVLIISLFSTILGLVQPYIAKLLIDEALLQRNLRALAEVALLMVVATVFGFVFSILASYRYVAVSADVLFDMRLALYEHLQRLSPRFYARTKLGEIVSRINNDVAEAQRVAADSLLSLVSNLIFLTGSVVIMLWLNWQLFVLSVALTPLSVFALRRYQRRLTGQVKQVRERSAEIGSFLIETLMGMRLVVTSNAEAGEVERFRRRNRGFIESLLAMQLTSYLAGAAPGAILTLSTAAVFLYGGGLVIEGVMSVGALVAFMAYHLRLLAPVQSLMGLYTSLVTARVSLGRIFELLDAKVEVMERPDAAALARPRGEITFEHVTLRHDRDNTVLDDVSFRIPAGARLRDSRTERRRQIDHRRSDPAFLRSAIGNCEAGWARSARSAARAICAAPSPWLINRRFSSTPASPKTSLTRGPTPHLDEIIEAARAAAIHEFIEKLPEGYDTQVGERGLTLSAGERQRIAIARAMLRRPSILVLDEPTAALDPGTEQAIATTLSTLLKGRTAIIITHRRSLVEISDQVIALEGGKVAQSDSPEELMASGGALVKLFGATQSG